MDLKDCPSCGAEVPTAASRCKHCFHDFNEAPPPAPKKQLRGFLMWLAALVFMGTGTFYWVVQNKSSANVVVDEETQSIIITETTADGINVQRVTFSEVEKIEYVIGGQTATFEVFAITDDDRILIQSSDDTPIRGHADHISAVIEKPIEEVRTFRTFGD